METSVAECERQVHSDIMLHVSYLNQLLNSKTVVFRGYIRYFLTNALTFFIVGTRQDWTNVAVQAFAHNSSFYIEIVMIIKLARAYNRKTMLTSLHQEKIERRCQNETILG